MSPYLCVVPSIYLTNHYYPKKKLENELPQDFRSIGNNNNRPKITSLLVLLVTFMRYLGNNNISVDVVFKDGHNDVLFIHNKVKLKEIIG